MGTINIAVIIISGFRRVCAVYLICVCTLLKQCFVLFHSEDIC